MFKYGFIVLIAFYVYQISCDNGHRDPLCPDNSATHLAADPKNPHVYHHCSYGKVVGNVTCKDEEVFDEAKQTCIEPVIVDKQCPSADGKFEDPKSPHRFIVCFNGHAYVFDCPVSLIWDNGLKKCVDNVDGKTWSPV